MSVLFHYCDREVYGKLHICGDGERIELLNEERLSIIYYHNNQGLNSIVIELHPVDFYKRNDEDSFFEIGSVESINEIIKALEWGKRKIQANG